MFKGQFKSLKPNGTPNFYTKGDVVLDQGRVYTCLSNTTQSPLQNPESWSLSGLSEVYSGSTPPINPVENQSWLGDNGRLYIWLKDSNGYQWVQT